MLRHGALFVESIFYKVKNVVSTHVEVRKVINEMLKRNKLKKKTSDEN